MGHEPLTKYIVLAVAFLQFTIAFLLRHTHPFSWKFIVAAYTIGGTANHNLFLAIHEITHNLAFKGVKANKVLAIIANLPIGVPYAISFKVNRHRIIPDRSSHFRPTGISLRTPQIPRGRRNRCRSPHATRTYLFEQRPRKGVFLVRVSALSLTSVD